MGGYGGVPGIPGAGGGAGMNWNNPSSTSSSGGGGGFSGYSIPGSGGSTGGSNGYNSGWQGLFGVMGYNGSPYGTSLIGPYNSQVWSDLWKSMSDIYGGHGMGNVIANYITSGAGFNPQALQYLFSTMDPTIAKSLATIGASGGASGTRYGSANDFADSNYLSQVYADQGQMAFNEYDQAQGRILSLLGQSGNLAAQQANGPGWLSSMLGLGSGIAGSALNYGMPGGSTASGLLGASGGMGAGGLDMGMLFGDATAGGASAAFAGGAAATAGGMDTTALLASLLAI